MYNISQVVDALEDLVGFKDETGYTLAAPLKLSTSSLTVNGFEPLITLQTIDNSKPSNIALDAFLIEMRRSAVQKVINDVMSKKIAKQVQKTTLEETPLINGTAKFNNLQNKKGRFVGWLFRVPESINLVHSLQKIMVQFSQNVTALNIYVYHSSQDQPIATKPITTTNAPSVSTIEFLDVNDKPDPITLKFQTDTTDAGGFYMIGYYEDDLPVGCQAIYKNINVGTKPCGYCDAAHATYYKKWNSYLKTEAVYVESSDLNGTSLPLLDDIETAIDTNFGLNFYTSIGCDLTDFIIKHKDVFAHALQTRLAMDLLRYIEVSPTRNNKVADSAHKEASFRINGLVSENNFVKVKGLIHEYDQFIESTNFNFSLLDKYCLPSIRSGVVWNK